MGSWKVRVLDDYQWMSMDILVTVRDHLGNATVAQGPLLFKEIKIGELTAPNAWKFDTEDGEEFLRAMMDAAWERGLRPTGYADHKNELKATRYHLEDMRILSKVTKS